MAQLKDWMQLVRVPNTLTACADSIAGFSFVVGPWFSSSESFLPVTMISIASIALYWAGMAMNDVNDVERDKAHRRLGPLVSERISVSQAASVSWILFGAGIVFAAAAGLFASGESIGSNLWEPLHFAPAGVAVLLTAAILAYDSRLKQTILGPWLMGLCRSLNLALGMAVGAVSIEFDPALMSSMMPGCWMLLAGHGLFVVGLTLAARKESMLIQSRMRLAACWGVSVAGLALIAGSASFIAPDIYQRLGAKDWFPVLIALLATPWALRVVNSVKHPNVSCLVPAIKQSILTILFLDAAVALQFADTGPGVLICLFAIPTFIMGRYFRMT
ncbi:MAG: UbiA family prenyltransferase [Pirellula sp.]|jgi:4-hydroxybenzoate polyprenyltransferase|nr:UbiA family prenyltransferase [Pirellula sp.]